MLKTRVVHATEGSTWTWDECRFCHEPVRGCDVCASCYDISDDQLTPEEREREQEYERQAAEAVATS